MNGVRAATFRFGEASIGDVVSLRAWNMNRRETRGGANESVII